MSDFQERYMRESAQAKAYEIDEGLRKYMLRVYNYMTMGIGLTGIVALYTANSDPLLQLIFGTPLKWVVILAPLGFVFAISAGLNRMRLGTVQILFWLFAAIMGLSMASIFLIYSPVSITRVFFITAGTFGAMSLYGYTTRRDLTGMGSFMFMGLIGIIIASVVNIFLASSVLHFAISVIGVLVFVGLTAYDTQRIKQNYYEGMDEETAGKTAIHGALRLYLDFINLFLMLLRLFGGARN